MRRPILALTLAAVAASAGAQSAFRGDAAHTGVMRDAAPRTFHRVKWSFPTGDRVVSSPVFADGTVYVGSDDGNLYAVDAASGRQRWMARTGGPVPSTPAVADGRVFVASYDGRIHAFDAKTGELLWKFATEGERRFEARGLHGMQPRQQTFADPYDVFLSSPLVVGGTVYVGSGDGHVYALDAASGARRWAFRTGEVVHASPAWADGLVVVGCWNGRVYALDAATGAERWHFQGGTDELLHNQQGYQASPAVAGGLVFVGGRDAKVRALDARSGQEKWSVDTAMSWVITSPAVAGSRVIFGTSDSSLLFAVDAASGREIWQRKAGSYLFSSPTVAGEVLLTGELNGTLKARDLASGEVLWEFRTEASRANAGWALTADARLNAPWLFPSTWREATALGFAKQTSTGSIFSTPLVVAGTVYVGSADGRLYAIE